MRKLKEVVVIDAVRSAIGKSGRDGMKKNGQLCQASAQDLLAVVMRGLLDRVHKQSSKFDESIIEDVVVGCLSQIGEQGANIARIAALIAGIPITASGFTVNQYCNAGLRAINSAAHQLMVGDGDACVCAGVEVMSHYGMMSDVQVAMEANYPVRMSNKFGEFFGVPQGACAEIISAQYGHTREQLDYLGALSMKKAVLAQRNGLFADHIIPFDFEWEGKSYHAEVDETLRAKAADDFDGFMKDLSTLKPPFKPDGMVTAGNSSQIVDGAGAVLLMTADKAEELGLEPLARILSTGVAGGEPVPMLLAPIPAAQKAMSRAGKTIDDMDVIEPNEAFMSPLVEFGKALGYKPEEDRVNPTGGAVALGHPIGASGVIYFGEMVHHLKRIKGRCGLQMICGGGGIGISTVVERV
ncbi:MAG: thiolase family protein [Proteobacteria bacterium]|nr:thiolase family protein [Pseudomonadota bacterium]MBU4470036.1 thiolase family protein [Pseudomonadota bacterium]MCG2753816.1 thiolase family protein [Desulfobacteraceae bacterium]